MNVLGKILVFLNLLFALAVGGFLLIDFQTRVNWKKAYDDLKREADVAFRNYKAGTGTIQALNQKMQDAEQKAEQARSEFAVAKTKFTGDLAAYHDQMLKSEELQKIIALAVAEKTKELQRFQLENGTLVKLLDKRDKTVLILEAEKDKYFKDAQQAINESQVAQARMQQMQKQLKEMTLQAATNQVVTTQYGKGPKFKDKNSPNPPPFYIKGKIEKVDSGGTLVELSLGSDQGLAVGQTLDAFRKFPEAKYLGMVQIVEVTAHKSVARLVVSQYGTPIPLKMNDEVASSILPGY